MEDIGMRSISLTATGRCDLALEAVKNASKRSNRKGKEKDRRK
jgi:hypothetical protein